MISKKQATSLVQCQSMRDRLPVFVRCPHCRFPLHTHPIIFPNTSHAICATWRDFIIHLGISKVCTHVKLLSSWVATRKCRTKSFSCLHESCAIKSRRGWGQRKKLIASGASSRRRTLLTSLHVQIVRKFFDFCAVLVSDLDTERTPADDKFEAREVVGDAIRCPCLSRKHKFQFKVLDILRPFQIEHVSILSANILYAINFSFDWNDEL